MSINLLLNKRKQTLRRNSLAISPAQPTGSIIDKSQSVAQAPIAESPIQVDSDPQKAASGVGKEDVATPPVSNAFKSNEPTAGKNAGITLVPGDPGKPPDAKLDKGHGAGAKFTPAKRSRVWDVYVKKTEEEDKDLVEDWDRIIDVTLVFAALFSAISTGFVLESSKNLQTDQSKATVLAIRDLTSVVRAGFNTSSGAGLSNPSVLSSDDDLFKPTITTSWVNCLWFLSLGLSISVSLFAMLAKRWCYVFKSKRIGTAYERAIKRQESWDAIEQWKIELVIEQLPTVMHIALMLFFIGLVVYLSEIHEVTMIVTAVLVGFTLVVYCILTVLPVWSQNCPMVTPFTRIISAAIWYILRLRGATETKIQSFFEAHIHKFNILYLYSRLPTWRDSYQATVLAAKQIFLGINIESTRRLAIGLIGKLRPFTQLPLDTTDWVIVGCQGPIGKTKPHSAPTSNLNPHAFRALVWMLNNSKDRETVKEILDHVMNFPEVILHSLATSEQLYAAAFTVAEHLNRFEHDVDEWRHTAPFNSLCARLVYLVARPWLHQSGVDGSGLSKIEDLSDSYFPFQATQLSPDELENLIAVIKRKKLNKSAESISWMEDLAGKIVHGCSAEPALKLCTALGKVLLVEEGASQTQDLGSEVHPTLWWILLNSVMDCTTWPHDFSSGTYWCEQDVVAASDSMLTLSHFRDSRKRQENDLWLTVIGVSGMLYAFSRYPDHEDGPAKSVDSTYFINLINILRSALHTSITGFSDRFVGELPVYHGAEVRLYEFNSLDYAIDALHCALRSGVYNRDSLHDDLGSLLHDFNHLKELRQIVNRVPDQGLDFSHIEASYKTSVQAGCSPDIWLATGLLRYVSDFQLDRERAKFFSRLLPDIIIGIPNSPSSNHHGSRVKINTATDWENHVETCDRIAALAWVPFEYDSPKFRSAFKAANVDYTRDDVIWRLLYNAGLLRIPLANMSQYRFRVANGGWFTYSSSSRCALGWCLYIKASLIERLHSPPETKLDSPNILEWSIALSQHFVELLEYWEDAEMNADEQAYVLTSLMQLVNTFLATLTHTSAPGASGSGQHQAVVQESPGDAATTRLQLQALVRAGLLLILSRPFSETFSSISACVRIPDPDVWRDDLARMIVKLAQEFPQPDLDSSRVRADEDSGSNDNNKNSFYADMITYYEAQMRRNGGTPSPILDLVKHLRVNQLA